MSSPAYLVGIDEAGRGPLAGPVFVGAVVVPRDFDWDLVAGVRDSKKLTSSAREAWYKKLLALRRSGRLDFAVCFSSASVVDRRGITPAIARALARALLRLEASPSECEILLDGSLRAPEQFHFQKTIIRGDDIEPVISLASIAAKVSRDRLMMRLSRRYPRYAFDEHKGYGTAKHREMLRECGLCEIHRRSYCEKYVSLESKKRKANSKLQQ